MSVTIVEGLAAAYQALTGLETVSLGSTIMINNSGTWVSVGSSAVYEIVKSSGARIVGSKAYALHNGVLGSFSGLDYNFLFDVGKAQLKNCLATPAQLSNGMRAALQNGGAQIGNTALKPVTDLVVQSTGTGQQVAVTTKGVLAKVAFETALIGAAAAIGVTVGIGITETNPQLVTKIYNRIFNDNVDPDQIADIVKNTTVWENIRDGVTFLSEDIIEMIKEVFIEEGIFSGDSTGDFSPIAENILVNGEMSLFAEVTEGSRKYFTKEHYKNIQISSPQNGDFLVVVNNGSFVKGTNNKYNATVNVSVFSNKPFTFTAERGISTDSSASEPPASLNYSSRSGSASSGQYGYADDSHSSLIQTPVYSSNNLKASFTTGNYPLSEAAVDTKNFGVPSSTPCIAFSGEQLPNTSQYRPDETDIAARYFGLGVTEGLVDLTTPSEPQPGIALKPGAVYPRAGKTLAEDYPDWDSNSVDTISDWNEDTQLPNRRKWYPVNSKADQSTGQDEAQDGSVDEEDITDVINDIDKALEENSDIAPETETQPDVYPNPNPAPGTDLYPVTPNPPDIDASDGEDPDPTIPILTTVATSGLAHIYNPTLGEVQSLGQALWTPSLIENIKKIFVNPMDGIIGFHILYATPKTGASEEIVLGYYGTGVNSKVVTNQYVEVDCGYVAVDEWWNDARDYEPYVNVSLYLPFIGIVPLKANDVIGSHVKVKYHVDVLTGTCLAMVEVQKYNARGTLYQFVGNCAITIPLSSGNYTAVITSLLSVASSAVGGAAIGGVGGALFGAFKGAAINAGRAKLQVIQSGNLGANAGAMGIRNPFLIIRRPMTKDAYAYNMQYGYPAFKWVTLGQVSGFTRVRSVHLNDVKCTDEEKDMIEAALKEGVIL